jgi:EmrB/QacA subfamily drug resistance transporter
MERSKQRMVLLVATTAGFLGTFMTSSVALALPDIEDQWNVSAVTLSWIALSYILPAAAFLMPVGRLADVYGRKRTFAIGMVWFTVVTLLAAVAPNAPVLIFLRLLQGLGMAVMLACTVAMVTLAYPPESRGRALGLQVGGVYLGLTLGPVLGGVIIQNLGWRYIFVLVAAAAAVDIVLTLWKLRGIEWREPKNAPFDVIGSAIWASGLTVLLLGFSFLPRTPGWVLIVLGAAGIAGFLRWETRVADPVLNVDLIRRNRVFAYSNLATFINYAATYAITFLMSLYLQYDKGLDPQWAGLVIVIMAVMQTLLSPVAGRLSDRVEARYVASAGMAVCVVGLAAFVFLSPTTTYWYIITALAVLGIGFAFFATPIIYAIMGSVHRRYTGVASATIGTMRLTGQNISMGLATLVLAVVVGPHPITKADYANVLTSVRITFAIFTVLCIIGVACSLVGPRPGEAVEGAGPDGLPIDPQARPSPSAAPGAGPPPQPGS